MGGYTIVLFCLFAACSTPDKPDPVDPAEADRALYAATSAHLVEGHVQGGGFVVSRRPGGEAVHLGEGLLWGGTALWAMSCDAGRAMSAALAAMVTAQGGALIRVDPLGEYEGGREVTVDGALGLYLGISRRVESCGEADMWREPLALHMAFLAAHENRLHPNVSGDGGTLWGGLKRVPEILAWRVGLRDSAPGIGGLETLLAGWVAGRHVGKQSCYPANLGLTALLTAETAGIAPSSDGRAAFCNASKGMSIPTLEHWCGRESIAGYASSYEVDLYEMRHQRGSWESPDGNGNTSPRLDLLVALVLLHGWEALQ